MIKFNDIKEVAPEKITEAQARAVINMEKQSRVKRCKERISKILAEEVCIMEPVVTLTPGGVKADIRFIALDK